MNAMYWMAFGLIVAVLSNYFERAQLQGGFAGAIFLGVLGALEGGYLASFLFASHDSLSRLLTFIVAFSGAVLLLYLRKTFSYFSDEPTQSESSIQNA
jgi:uncharacterized membrane protein YeaQ/YmgE (transglycosylase-associated protein family)